MFFRQVFDPKLAQYAYLIGCQQTGEALVIDPERDVDRYISMAEEEGLRIVAATETHIHADFLSGSRELAERLGARVYLSDEGNADWKYQWAETPDYEVELLKDNDSFRIGKIEIRAIHTPGHTPEHLSFLVTDYGGGADEAMGIASGDFVFVSDLGRPDLLESAAGQEGLMEPSARTLFRSVQQFLDLPDHLQVWPGHGAGSACGKALGAVPGSTVGYERRFNPAIAAVRQGEDAFVAAILEGQPEPPLYFARMKRQNKMGPPILGALPRPRSLSAEDLAALAEGSAMVVVDAREDRREFMAGHVPGSLFAPLDRTFPTITGSYIEEGAEIVLVLEQNEVEEAVRDLVRIGLDRVVAYATPEVLVEAGQAIGLRSMPVLAFDEAIAQSGEEGLRLLDVRRQVEFGEGHLPGAQNIAHTRLLRREGELERDSRWAVYCRSGARAASASALLEHLGHDVVYIDDSITELSPDRLVKGNEAAVAEVR